MRIGIPRGQFYYDCFGFIQRLFDAENDIDDIELVFGPKTMRKYSESAQLQQARRYVSP